MRPYKDINIGDIYQRYSWGNEYVVLNKDDDEKMVEIQAIDNKGNLVLRPFWKTNRDSIFNNRVHSALDRL